MMNTELLRLNASETIEKITDFISYEVEKSGLDGAVVSLSGGIDSAVVFSLTVKALGPERVTALTIPERDITPQRDVTDVMRLAEAYDVTCDTVEITPILEQIRESIPEYDEDDRLSTGNLKPRLRMMISYHYANALNRMVIGSSNKTEYLTGYFTKYGDGGCDLLPLADLYKNQIRQISKALEIPEEIIEKTPSAGLWPGQTDEGEIGASYDTIDLILYGTENGLGEEEISSQLGVEIGVVKRILGMVKRSGHKRRLPLILRLTSLTE